LASPEDAERIELDEDNEAKLAAHRISPDELFELWENGPVWVPNRRDRKGDWKMLGLTAGGRKLTVVVRYNEDQRALRPITGWDATKSERTRYFGR
jgi:uncharacterized DUF497 family protein